MQLITRYAGVLALLLLMASAASAQAQDIKGLEVCTAEKQIERRTACLQSNVEFLQQALSRETRRSQEALAAAGRAIAALQADMAALKSALARTQAELAALKPVKPAEK